MKEKNKRKKARLGGIVFLAFLALYIPSLVYWLRGGHIATDIIRMGTIEESITASGYIIRDSVLYRAPFDGKFIPEVEEGERVAAYSPIATVLKDSSVKLLDLMEEVELKIIQAQTQKIENLQIFSGDIEKLETEIGNNVRQIIDESNTNRFSGVGKTKENIYKLIRKRAEILGGMTTGDAYINALKKEKESIQAQINSNKRDIISDTAGIVSYIVDEYEEVLTPEAIPQLKPEHLEKLAKDSQGESTKREVNANKPFAKVIKGNYFYIAIPLSVKEASRFKTGDEIKIRIHDINREVRCSVYHISEAVDNRCVLVVRLDRCMSETSGYRKLNVDLVRNSHEGFKIPLKSLMDVDLNKGTAKIVLVRFNTARIRDVVIKGWDGESAIIDNPENNRSSGIGLYETYVVNPKNIEEGQIINK